MEETASVPPVTPPSVPSPAPVVSVTQTGVPDEIKGWSWGGFLWSWIWAIGNNTWIGLLALVPFMSLIMAIVLGVKGREWAWKNKHWASVEEFKRVQRNWAKWWLILILPLCILSFVLSMFASVLLVAINPARQFSLANNTKRMADIAAIQKSLKQYAADHKGEYPAGLTTSNTKLDSTDGKEICLALVPAYLSGLPVDPNTDKGVPVTDCSSVWTTGYTVSFDKATDQLTVSAPDAELEETISVTH